MRSSAKIMPDEEGMKTRGAGQMFCLAEQKAFAEFIA